MKVLVTGGSGFLGSHTILRALAAGHTVRTTVRHTSRECVVRELLAYGGAVSAEEVEVVAADLTRDDRWRDAVDGCEVVLHVASPFPGVTPEDENDLVVPAREGTLRVLRAGREAGVRRVVVTSSFAAVGYGHPQREASFTEEDWTDPDGPDVEPYIRSKVLAERAAWDFVEREGKGMELTVVNPVGIFGPALGKDFSSSIGIVKRMLDGDMPACPRLYFGVVDVRDAADLHVRAMTASAAAGQRFIAVAGEPISMLDAANVLRERLGEAASRVPRRQLPDWLVRLMAGFNPTLRPLAPQLGRVRRASSDKAKRLLAWAPRSTEDAVAATGESLLRLGLVKRGVPAELTPVAECVGR